MLDNKRREAKSLGRPQERIPWQRVKARLKLPVTPLADHFNQQPTNKMTRKCVLATSQLNQWVLDYDGNRDRIIEAITLAKTAGASLILTPELCIPGYGLLDHWLENDVYNNSWDIAADIVSRPECQDIIIDLGLPIRHRGCSYNARLIALDGEVLAIRPKQIGRAHV